MNERILIARPDRVGDVVISSSCLEPIHARYPQAEIYWMTQAAQGTLFDGHPHIHGWLEVPRLNEKLFFDRVRFMCEKINAVRPHTIVVLDPRADVYLAAWLAKVPARLGWQLERWSWTLTQTLPNLKRQGLKHEGFYNFDLLKHIDVKAPEELKPHIAPRQSDRIKFEQLISGSSYAVLNPSAFSPIARWSPENFAELGRWLHRERGLKLVIIGDKEGDRSALLLTELLRGLGEGVLNLAGKTNLAELAWILEKAKVLITRDTGPSHIAAAMGCPVVVIFGRTAPLYGPIRWAPLTENVVVLAKTTERNFLESKSRYWKRSFDAITVEEVKEAVENLLKKR